MEFTEEQQVEVTRLVEEATNNTKETYKEFMSKEASTKFTQSETDKVRTSYSKQIKDYEDKLKGLIPVAKSDAEIAMEQRLLALEGKEKEVGAKEKLLSVSNDLQAQVLPTELAKRLKDVKIEDMETEIGKLKATFDATKLDNTYKPTGHKNDNDSITKEQFSKMSYMQRINLFKSNEELYSKISK